MISRGFTLLELLVVLAIVGLLAGVAVPSAARVFGGADPWRSLAEVRGELAMARAGALRAAREAAVTVTAGGGVIVVASGARERAVRASWLAGEGEPAEVQGVVFDSSGLADRLWLEFSERGEGEGMILVLPFDPVSGVVGRAERKEVTR